MAIGFVAATSQDITYPTAETPVTFAFDAGSAANRFMALFANNRDITISHYPDGGFLYNGITMTPFGANLDNSGTDGRGFYLVAPASGSNNVSCDLEQDFPGDVAGIVSVAVYGGVDQTTPFDDYTTGQGADNTAEITIDSATGDVPVIMAGWRIFSSTTHSGSNYTERWSNVFPDNSATGGEGEGAASVAMVATDDDNAVHSWVAIGFNLNAIPDTAPGAVLDYSAFPKKPFNERAA